MVFRLNLLDDFPFFGSFSPTSKIVESLRQVFYKSYSSPRRVYYDHDLVCFCTAPQDERIDLKNKKMLKKTYIFKRVSWIPIGNNGRNTFPISLAGFRERNVSLKTQYVRENRIPTRILKIFFEPEFKTTLTVCLFLFICVFFFLYIYIYINHTSFIVRYRVSGSGRSREKKWSTNSVRNYLGKFFMLSFILSG